MNDDERASLLLVDNDAVLCDALGRALAGRGFDVTTAFTAAEAIRIAGQSPPEYAVIDLKLPDGSGLKLIPRLIDLHPYVRIVVQTSHASIPTAVEAIKLGATYYLAKPTHAEDVISALHRDSGDDSMPLNGKPLSIRRLEWEHIQRILHAHGGNVSATARALSMHRRTLQRKLRKHPVGN